MSKYPRGIATHVCQECGHPLGLKAPVWWWKHKLCSTACKTLYRAQRWRYWRQRWLKRIYPRLT
jgi:hypothetical protein